MISPEQLINDLQNELNRIKEELEQAQKDIKDFEELAVIWKDSYQKMEARYKIKLGNADKIIEQLEDELNEFKSNRDRD